MSVEDTLAERGERYGDFTDHAAVCQRIKLAMIAGAAKWAGLPDTHKQALEVIADKIARILTGDPNYADNWHDIQGYAKLVEDRLPKVSVPHQEGETIIVHTPEQAVAVRGALLGGPVIHTMSNPPGEDIYSKFAGDSDRHLRRAVALSTPVSPGEDIYAEFAARINATERKFGKNPALGAGYGLVEDCPECGYPTDAAGTHYATCSRLTAPEEYKAEAQGAFDEAARGVGADMAEAMAPGHTIRPPEDVLAEVSEAWRRTAEPAAAMDDDSARMQAIGQNGEMAEEVYAAVDAADPFAGAPDWAEYKAQDLDGSWNYFQDEPFEGGGQWDRSFDRKMVECGVGEPNPKWRDTRIQRKQP